jgi:cysteinyl-tRNA synthetase
MTIQLFNTLSNSIEEIAPSDGQTLRMYACGPTVYDYGHVGNFPHLPCRWTCCAAS